MDAIAQAKALLEAHGYKVSQPTPRKETDYHDYILSLIASYGTRGVTSADLASDQRQVKNSVGEAIHTLAKFDKIKCIGRGVSAATGRLGRRWVTKDYEASAQRMIAA